VIHTLTEGLKEYRVFEELCNSYFIDIEYRILILHQPSCFLPVQIRDRDGSSQLLYEVSGLKDIQSWMKNHTISKEELQSFLKDIKTMITTVDDYMLDIRQVCFLGEYIFRDKEGHYLWMYLPVKESDIKGKIEDLFEWILSSIDYSDFDVIQYAYYAYWRVRNYPFNEVTLQKCIDYTTKDITDHQTDSYESFFEEKVKTEFPSEDREKSIERMGKVPENYAFDTKGLLLSEDNYPIYDQDKRKVQKPEKLAETPGVLFFLEIFCWFVTIALTVMFIAFLTMAFYQNILMEIRFLLFGILFGIVLTSGLIRQIRLKRREVGDGEIKEKTITRDIPSPSYNYSWEENGTEVLGIRKDMLQPAFRSLDDGRIFVVNVFPYFIGSVADMNQMVIEEPSVSRRHAAVIRGRQTGHYELQDLKSTNGTWIEDVSLTYDKPVRLEPGMRVRFAGKGFEFIMLDRPSL